MSEEEIAIIGREKFKTLVDKNVKSYAFKYLTLEAGRHSKSEEIAKNTNFQKKSYFSDRRFSKDDVQLLFSLRTKILDCKNNFKEQYNNILHCRICKNENTVENEDHLLTCSVLNSESYDVKFADVYGNIDVQYKATQAFKKVMRRRSVYIAIMYIIN